MQTAPSGSSADYVNRIFTVVNEMPFAGHPSLGTAVAVAHERGDTDVRYVQRTHAGEQPVDVQLDGRSARASMLQEPATFGDEADPPGDRHGQRPEPGRPRPRDRAALRLDRRVAPDRRPARPDGA